MTALLAAGQYTTGQNVKSVAIIVGGVLVIAALSKLFGRKK